MSETIRNRIKGHRRVRAGELVPHELNWRLHPEGQRKALQALYGTVGFARSLLAYELPDGRLKLIDGHLRRDMDPDMEVEEEAKGGAETVPEQFLVLVTCRDERQQVKLLEQFRRDGLECRALLS